MQTEIKSREVQTRIGTRAILRQLEGGKTSVHKLEALKLHQQETASFIVRSARNMWFAAHGAGMGDLALKVEAVFCEAFEKSGKKIDLESFVQTSHKSG
jgi:hypothetical protein